MNRASNTLLIATIAILPTTAAIAVDRVTETFTYADGNLVGQTPTPPGVAWIAASDAGTLPVQVTGGEILLAYDLVSDGEDVSIVFTPTLTSLETIYAGFDLRLPSGQSISPSSPLQIASFAQLNNASQRARLFLAAPSVSGFRLGLDTDSGTPSQLSADLSFDTVYRLVITYNNGDGSSISDSAELRIYSDRSNPPDQTLTDSVGANVNVPINRFSFFQRVEANQGATIVIDNLVVTDTDSDAVPVTLLGFSIE